MTPDSFFLYLGIGLTVCVGTLVFIVAVLIVLNCFQEEKESRR